MDCSAAVRTHGKKIEPCDLEQQPGTLPTDPWRSDSVDTILLTPAPNVVSTASVPATMERRGSRARRRMLALDTAAAEAPSNNGSLGVEQNEREQDDPPVIDTTSVEVERKAD
ncbi:unnamed protein product, partial [Ectocarpus sp. 4 AP-2014]